MEDQLLASQAESENSPTRCAPGWNRLRSSSFSTPEPYVVTRDMVRAFALATLDTDPVHHDVAAARDAGHSDLLAPSTMVSALALYFALPVRESPDLGMDMTKNVHGEHHLQVLSPLVAGTSITAETWLDDIRLAGPHVRFSTTSEVRSTSGNDLLAVVRHVCVVRGAGGPT